ncbi:YveK family protein [Alicyclobacillus macrosporangiidus]|uniref:Capsular polysaccharide biosynthesis protein n=1 Tax=Alicyclobacillus macrosporangiidus TaxID=392015 RepID=A0A1I7G5J0_9BACL|nr:Wzz/FepE/Etk N-terminal domain-containing protein [Alicyclobacillus macrosporangiidus]SFU43693.1 Capsular polysaccharide biosynthesis protein [Alicyclobacillus macrosporangiidus]
MEELELREYWYIIRKRLTMVLAIPLIAMIASGALSFFVLKPQYEADTTLLVNQKASDNPSLEYQMILANQALVNTYSDIIKSATIERAVIQNLRLPYTLAEFDKMVQVTAPDKSQVIDVKVTDPSQVEAVKIANALATEFQQRAQQLMNVENVQIIDPAVVNPDAKPVKPNKTLNIAVALVLGLMVSIGLAFLLEYLDTRLKNEEDVRRYLNLPVLGVIGDYEEK